MIQHAEKLDINLKQVLTEYDGTNLWNVQYAYINSLKNFNFKIGLESDILYKSNPNFIKNYNKNIIVIDQIENVFREKATQDVNDCLNHIGMECVNLSNNIEE